MKSHLPRLEHIPEDINDIKTITEGKTPYGILLTYGLALYNKSMSKPKTKECKMFSRQIQPSDAQINPSDSNGSDDDFVIIEKPQNKADNSGVKGGVGKPSHQSRFAADTNSTKPVAFSAIEENSLPLRQKPTASSNEDRINNDKEKPIAVMVAPTHFPISKNHANSTSKYLELEVPWRVGKERASWYISPGKLKGKTSEKITNYQVMKNQYLDLVNLYNQTEKQIENCNNNGDKDALFQSLCEMDAGGRKLEHKLRSLSATLKSNLIMGKYSKDNPLDESEISSSDEDERD